MTHPLYREALIGDREAVLRFCIGYTVDGGSAEDRQGPVKVEVGIDQAFEVWQKGTQYSNVLFRNIRPPIPTQQAYQGIANGCQCLWCCSYVHLAVIFPHRHVSHRMPPILNRPMPTPDLCKLNG